MAHNDNPVRSPPHSGGGSAPRPPEKHISRQAAILIRDGNMVELTDLDTAAYLFRIGGLTVSFAEKIGPSRHRIVLYDPEHKADRLALKFINSESEKFASGIRAIKKVLHSFGGKRRRSRR